MGLISVKRCKCCGRKGVFLTLREGDLCSVCYQKAQEAQEASRIKAELLQKIEEFNESHSLSSLSRTSTVVSCPHSAPYIILDTETTGLNPSSDKIIQLSAIKYNSSGTPVDFYNTYLNPGRPIPAGASRVNGITDDMVSNAPVSAQIIDEFLAFVAGYLIVGYNVTFDLKFLNNTFEGVFSGWKYVDALTMARRFLSMPEYKLSTVSSLIGFVPSSAFHDSFTDCEAVAAVLQHIGEKFQPWIKVFGPALSQSRQEPEISNPSIPCELSGKDFETALGFLSQGEEKRINGDIEAALYFFDRAREIGYTSPMIYESYAKAYRKLKDYEKEISILDEAISHYSGPIADSFMTRKKRAEELMIAARKRENANIQKEQERAEKAEARRKKREMEESKPKKSCKRAIIQYADDGTIIKEFDSISAATQELGISSKCIRDAALGKQKHAGGFCWKYVSPDISDDELSETTSI